VQIKHDTRTRTNALDYLKCELINNKSSFALFAGKRYSESLAGTLLPDWIGKSLFTLLFPSKFSFDVSLYRLIKLILDLVLSFNSFYESFG
jgi:hypothetical protein